MDPKKLIKGYLEDAKVMQLATTNGGQPWVCSVYFVADKNMQLYWLSWPTRRHSKELTKNPKVAVAIQIKTDQPVIGIQAEGTAQQVTNNEEMKGIADMYMQKHGAGQKFYDNFLEGTNKHQMYRFTPNTYVLFDELHFTDNQPRQVKP